MGDTALAAVCRESKATSCAHLPVLRFGGDDCAVRTDSIIQESELTVYVNGVRHHETTCSPWDVEELVVGSLFMGGELCRRADLRSVEIDLAAGIASVELRCPRPSRAEVDVRSGTPILSGLFEGLDSVAPAFTPVSSALRISPKQVNDRIALLEDRSLLFRRTGGVHSAVLADGRGVTAWFEDIGRHSALDKLAGWCFLHEVDVRDKTLLFSGRVPREIIAKVIRLGCPVVVSPGAPTTLSIELADRWGVTLVGFAKHGSFNVYAHPERIGR